jgi:hypothetical protein
VNENTESTLVAAPVRTVELPVNNIKIEAKNIPASAYEALVRDGAGIGPSIDFTPDENDEEEYVSTFTRAYRFLTHHVSLRREQSADEESIYAFRLETKAVSIYKTFRGF